MPVSCIDHLVAIDIYSFIVYVVLNRLIYLELFSFAYLYDKIKCLFLMKARNFRNFCKQSDTEIGRYIIKDVSNSGRLLFLEVFSC